MIHEQDIRNVIKAADVDVDPYLIPVSENFKNAGLDSLDVFNIFLELEKITNKEIPDDDFKRLQSIESILSYINDGQ